MKWLENERKIWVGMGGKNGAESGLKLEKIKRPEMVPNWAYIGSKMGPNWACMWAGEGLACGRLREKKIGPKNWLGWVPYGALPKFQKKFAKRWGRCGHVAAECSGVAGALPAFAQEGCRPFVHSPGIPAISFLKLQIKGLGFR